MSQATASSAPIATTSTQASRAERFIAAIVDCAILTAVYIPIVIVMGAVGLYSFGFFSSVIAMIAAVGIFVALNFKLLKERGQTWGKKLMKIKIVSQTNDQILDIKDLLIKRYVPVWGSGMIPWIGFAFPLIDACCIFRENELCLHDEIAKTKVVKE